MADYMGLRPSRWLKSSPRSRSGFSRLNRWSHFDVAHVRPYGADHQWVKVPRQEESVCLGSLRAAWMGNRLGWSLVTKST